MKCGGNLQLKLSEIVVIVSNAKQSGFALGSSGSPMVVYVGQGFDSDHLV